MNSLPPIGILKTMYLDSLICFAAIAVPKTMQGDRQRSSLGPCGPISENQTHGEKVVSPLDPPFPSLLGSTASLFFLPDSMKELKSFPT